MIAITQTVSSSVKPSRVSRGLFIRRGRYVGRGPGAALDAVGAERGDLDWAPPARRTIAVGLAPRVVRPRPALEIGAVPRREPASRLDQCGGTFGARRVATG